MSASASHARMMLASNLGDDCLVQALDAAETVGTRNALERMVALGCQPLQTLTDRTGEYQGGAVRGGENS
jgi:hypothetical protein